MNFIEEAAELNRRGVYLLYVGEITNAYHTFNKASAGLVSYISTQAKTLQGSQSSAVSESLMETCLAYNAIECQLHQTNYGSHIGPIIRNANSTAASTPTTTSSVVNEAHYYSSRILPVCIPGLEDDKVYIYNSAIIFYPPEQAKRLESRSSSSIMNDCFLYNAIILFNIALCVHVLGKINCNHYMLNNSVQTYEICLKMLPLILPSCSCYRFDTNYRDCMILGIVASNNIVQIYHETNQSITNPKLNDTLNLLSTILACFCILPPFHHQQHSLQNMEVLVTEILKNIIVLSYPNYYYYCAPCA